MFIIIVLQEKYIYSVHVSKFLHMNSNKDYRVKYISGVFLFPFLIELHCFGFWVLVSDLTPTEFLEGHYLIPFLHFLLYVTAIMLLVHHVSFHVYWSATIVNVEFHTALIGSVWNMTNIIQLFTVIVSCDKLTSNVIMLSVTILMIKGLIL